MNRFGRVFNQKDAAAHAMRASSAISHYNPLADSHQPLSPRSLEAFAVCRSPHPAANRSSKRLLASASDEKSLVCCSCQLSVVRGQLSVEPGYRPVSVVSCQLSVVSCQLSVVSCQLSVVVAVVVVSCQLSVVSCQLSVAGRRGSEPVVMARWRRPSVARTAATRRVPETRAEQELFVAGGGRGDPGSHRDAC